ncbi:UNVERIFIED_CONTAM: hypothetical protein GTU68_009335 [Idotea baltica]|nr:hypothetical protein [Idotea baltica]
MINQEDYDVIIAVEVPGKSREGLLSAHRYTVARTFINMLSHISKDQTIQYILTIVDDILSEDKSRVVIFQEYSRKHKESMWSPFLNLLTRPDAFIVNMTARIVAKLACWTREPMEGSDLTYYLTWLKDQLRTPSNEYLRSVGRCLQMMLRRRGVPRDLLPTRRSRHSHSGPWVREAQFSNSVPADFLSLGHDFQPSYR